MSNPYDVVSKDAEERRPKLTDWLRRERIAYVIQLLATGNPALIPTANVYVDPQRIGEVDAFCNNQGMSEIWDCRVGFLADRPDGLCKPWYPAPIDRGTYQCRTTVKPRKCTDVVTHCPYCTKDDNVTDVAEYIQDGTDAGLLFQKCTCNETYVVGWSVALLQTVYKLEPKHG